MTGIFHTSITLQIAFLICIRVILRRTFEYCRTVVIQLEGVKDPLLSSLYKVSLDCLSPLKIIQQGFSVFLIKTVLHIFIVHHTIDIENYLTFLFPILALFDGLALGLICYGLILYIKGIERNKPARLLRPIDIRLAENNFENQF